MSDPQSDQPIQVNQSAIPEQAGAVIRTLLVAVGGYMAGKGWIDSNIAAALVPAVMVLGPMLWSQLRVLKTHGQRVTLANYAPDSVAQVKPS